MMTCYLVTFSIQDFVSEANKHCFFFFKATLFGGHVRLVFTLVLGIFIVCVTATLTSYAEIPLDVLANSPTFPGKSRRRSSVYNKFVPDDTSGSAEMEKLDGKKEYGSFDRVVSFEEKPQHVQGNPFVKATIFRKYTPCACAYIS